MAFNKESNLFTFGFAIGMVVIVGTILAFTSISLKPLQEKNVADKKRMDILKAVGIVATRNNAAELYEQYVREAVILNHEGQPKEGNINAFDVNIQQEYRDRSLSQDAKNYPLYVLEKDGETYYVIPMVGKGLWGPIWGYVSLEDDYKTIYGATFDHKSETPGLGAEIKQDMFEEPFEGKKIADQSGSYEPIVVAKGGAAPGSEHEVDAITGGTVTSKGVEEMMDRTLKIYKSYFDQLGAE